MLAVSGVPQVDVLDDGLSDIGGEEALLAAEVVLRGQLHTPPHITPSHHHTLAYIHTHGGSVYPGGAVCLTCRYPKNSLSHGGSCSWAVVWSGRGCHIAACTPLFSTKERSAGSYTSTQHSPQRQHTPSPPTAPLCGRTMVCLSSLCLALICSYSDSPVMAGGWCGAVAVRAWKRRCTSAAAA